MNAGNERVQMDYKNKRIKEKGIKVNKKFPILFVDWYTRMDFFVYVRIKRKKKVKKKGDSAILFERMTKKGRKRRKNNNCRITSIFTIWILFARHYIWNAKLEKNLSFFLYYLRIHISILHETHIFNRHRCSIYFFCK